MNWTSWLKPGFDGSVRITGVASNGIRYESLHGVVATVGNGAVKVWPESPGPMPGKLWFEFRNIERVELEEVFE